MSIPALLNPKVPKVPSPLSTPLLSPSTFRSTLSPRHTIKCYSLFPSSPSSSLSSTFCFHPPSAEQNEDDDEEEEHVIGDCLVIEEGVFEDPYLQTDSSPNLSNEIETKPSRRPKGKKNAVKIKEENLIPDQWREVQAELNLTKKDRKKIALELQHGSRLERKKKGLAPVRSVNLEEYAAYREAKLAQLKPVVLDEPTSFDERDEERRMPSGERVKGKNPRWAVYGKGLDTVTEFLNSGNYVPGENNSEGRRKLFSPEEKVELNKKIPDLAVATSDKWLPLHALAASGEFYLMDALLKHDLDINAVDKDGLTALHKAIMGKKQAITDYLLRESANPFVRDKDGATLMHYAVQTASTQAIKVLLLYNVDINLQDNDGWTPLHIAVQSRRTDVVRVLLIKGADKTLKNKDGLTPLELCLYLGRDTRTYELIKLLKQLPKRQ